VSGAILFGPSSRLLPDQIMFSGNVSANSFHEKPSLRKVAVQGFTCTASVSSRSNHAPCPD
jgi:hypothetical protein